MKWQVKVDGNNVGVVRGESHEEAVQQARDIFHLSDVGKSRLTVEPKEEEGKCHDNRNYSQSGPVLSEDQL